MVRPWCIFLQWFFLEKNMIKAFDGEDCEEIKSICVFHNIRWSKYKARVFSVLHELLY